MAPEVIKSEIFVAQEVLPKHGFTDILLTRPISNYFPFDILARKNGKLCGIEVTMRPEYKLDPRKKTLIRYLSLRPFVCFVKPDFTWYFLKEISGNHVSAEGVFMEYMRRRT
ncbi:MAG: hypothetical protein ACE5Z5_11900 [Candidatus Bathyarchaeia archaeon]